MKIELLDVNKSIVVNKLQQVTSHFMMSNKMVFDPNGIMSNEIFGISKGDRRGTFAYIDLKRKFIHPHVYTNVLKGIFRGVIFIASGQRKYSIQDGLPIEDPNGWTGLQALYEHWDEIDWSKSKSKNKDAKSLLTGLTKDQIFLDKFLVCPPAYRDVMIAGTIDSSDHTNPVNDKYQKLIRCTNMLMEGGVFARRQYMTEAKIQDLLVEIFEYFESMISKKNGLIRKNLMGKSIDYGTRSVISAPQYNHNRFEDNIIDSQHSAVPISECCSTFYPFIETYLKNFFQREVINDPNVLSYYDPEKKMEITATLKDPEIMFSEKNIRKMINDYMLNPDNRFRVIKVMVNVPDGKSIRVAEAVMRLKGKIILPNNATEVLNRPLTITDLLYLACVDACEKRHVMVSRYPVGTDKGIYFNKVHVRSTAKTIKLIFNGIEYPFYPDIDIDMDPSKVGVQFIDSLVLSNSHCEGMGEQKCLRSCKTSLIAGTF